MYFLFRSFYTHVGWGQRLFYKGVQMFIDDETKQKIVLAADGAPAGLVSLFHPSQLEKRFGGERDTPTNFWPPYMGTEFIAPEEKKEKHNLMSPEEYDRICEQNPEIYVHPLHMKPGRTNNMHFRLDSEEGGEEVKGQPIVESVDFDNADGPKDTIQTSTGGEKGKLSPFGDPTTTTRVRENSQYTNATSGSVYMDAYTGLEELEEQKLLNDHLSR